MPLLLMKLGAHPEEIAATQRGECLEGGAFFLDFTRPLRRERWFLVWNGRIGPVLALHVPVIHQGEAVGRRSIAVERADPYFRELQRLWATRHPARRGMPAVTIDEAQMAADFAAQFPDDAARWAGPGPEDEAASQ